MIQNTFSETSQFSVALTYDSRRRLTYALVHGLTSNEIHVVTTGIIGHKVNIALPMLLPALLVRFRVNSAVNKMRDCREQIIRIERETGIRTKWRPENPCCAAHKGTTGTCKRYDVLDFDRITADLTSTSTLLAYCEYLCNIHVPMLDSFDRINERLVELVSVREEERLKAVEINQRTEHNFLRTSLFGVRCRAQYSSKRVQSQIQTVGFVTIPNLSNIDSSVADIQLDCTKR